MRTNLYPIIAVSIVVVIIVSVLIFVAYKSPHYGSNYKRVSAPGSLEPGDRVSIHFEASIDRLNSNTFRVNIKPLPTKDDVYLEPGPTYMGLLVLYRNGKQATKMMPLNTAAIRDLSPYGIRFLGSAEGPKEPDGHIRSLSRTFTIDTSKLKPGVYTVSARVWVAEEGKDAVMGNKPIGGISARVSNYFTLVVK